MPSSSSPAVASYDVIVVGAGIAGLSAARRLTDRRVALVAPGRPNQTGASSRARGGIAAAVGPDDSPDRHGRDTVEAGAGLCDREAVEELVEAAPGHIRELEELSAGFDRDDEGRLALGREAAHSRDRIVHADGDRSGRAVVGALADAVAGEGSHLDFVRGKVVDLCRAGGRIGGVLYRGACGRLRGLAAPAVILATGGIGGLYGKTTNPGGLDGRGLAMAYRAGAVLTNLEFVQFHPTALETTTRPLPLLTEALRGAGAALVDRSGTAIMDRYDKRGELAPRDVVARAVYRERQNGRAVYLDVSPVENLAERFPGTIDVMEAHGDVCRAFRLPVTPAAHYHMGGVATDLEGRTSVDGLWAAGEVAHTGVHGANRLASNSMLECLVFGTRAGRSVDASLEAAQGPAPGPVRSRLERRAEPSGDRESEAVERLTDAMWRSVGVERRGPELREAAEAFAQVRSELSPGERARETALVAELIARSAWRREESRGAHRRSDFPTEHEGWSGRIEVRRGDGCDAPAESHWTYVPRKRGGAEK